MSLGKFGYACIFINHGEQVNNPYEIVKESLDWQGIYVCQAARYAG